MTGRLRLLGSERGVTFVVVLVMVVILGLSAGIAGSTWRTIVQRAKEEELLFRGDQYRRAIESYYRVAHAGAQGMYPRSLDDLVKDPRSLQTLRHIRKLYEDPIGGGEWEIIREGGTVSGTVQASGGTAGIIGVRSRSALEPFKKDGFSRVYDDFKEAEQYSDWQFVYRPDKKKTQAPAQEEKQ